MKKIVLDTNVLVSSLLANGPPAVIVDLAAGGILIPFYNDLIISEYWNVLQRPKFGFQSLQVTQLVNNIISTGIAVDIGTPSSIHMKDEEDRKFYDLAKDYSAFLVTGNLKHFPQKSFIVSPADFLRDYLLP